MQGFVVFDFADKYAEARKQLAQWVAEGKLKRKETIVRGGITKAEEALVALFEGKNTGMLAMHCCLCGPRANGCRQDHGAGSGSRSCQGEAISRACVCVCVCLSITRQRDASMYVVIAVIVAVVVVVVVIHVYMYTSC